MVAGDLRIDFFLTHNYSKLRATAHEAGVCGNEGNLNRQDEQDSKLFPEKNIPKVDVS